MKRALVFIVSIVALAQLAQAQQNAQFSQYMQNYFLVNPGEGGTEEFTDIKIGARSQWNQLEGSPTTYFVSAHTALGKKVSRFDDVRQMAFHGVGGYVMKDQTGPLMRNSGYLSYSYHMPVSAKNDFVISFGMNVGFKNYVLDESLLKFEDNDDELTDDAAVYGLANSTTPDATAGVWGYSNHYFFGLSLFQLLGNEASRDNPGSVLARHWMVTAGYKIDLTPDWTVVPSFVIKNVTDGPTQLDLNAKVRYKGSTFVGGSYRHKDAVVGIVGYTWNNFAELSYSYDFNTSALNQFNTGSHELLLGIYPPLKKQGPPPAQFW